MRSDVRNLLSSLILYNTNIICLVENCDSITTPGLHVFISQLALFCKDSVMK